MEKASQVLVFLFSCLGLYVVLLASEAETSQKAQEIVACSSVFWLPAVLFYVLGAKHEETEK